MVDRRYAIELRHRPGLGDTCVAIASAYHFAELGYRVRLVRESYPKNWYFDTTHDVQLPHRPVWEPPAPGQPIVRLSHGWIAPFINARGEDWALHMTRMLDMPHGIMAPPHAALRREPWFEEYVTQHVDGQSYIVLAPWGHYEAPYKDFSRDQIRIVLDAAKRLNLAVVVVHSKRMDDELLDQPHVINLTGQTSIPELCALISNAEIVVSCDTGTMHVAAAYMKPTVAAISQHLVTPQVFARYMPFAWLITDGHVSAIPPRRFVRALRAIIAAKNSPWGIVCYRRRPCGVAVQAHRIAEAAGDTEIIEMPDLAMGESADAHNIRPDDLPPVLIIEQWETIYCDYVRQRLGSSAARVWSMHRPDIAEHTSPQDESRIVIAHNAAATHAAWVHGLLPVPAHLIALRDPPPTRPYRPAPSPQRVVLGWHGIVLPHKRLDMVAEAVQVCRERGIQAELHILGSIAVGEENEHASLQIANALRGQPGVHIRLQRFWSDEELWGHIQQADILLDFSWSPYMEASAVAADVMGVGRPLLVPPGHKHWHVLAYAMATEPSAEAIANAVEQLVSNPSLYHEYAERNWRGGWLHAPSFVADTYRAVARQAVIEAKCRQFNIW